MIAVFRLVAGNINLLLSSEGGGVERGKSGQHRVLHF